MQINKDLSEIPLNDIQLEGSFLVTKKTPGLGHALYVDSVTLVPATFLTDPSVGVNFGMTLNSEFIGDKYDYVTYYVGQSGTVTIPMKKILKYGEAVYVIKATAETEGNVTAIISAYLISADTNWAAKNVMYCFGDSVANLSSYITRVGGHMFNTAKLAVNTVGYDARMIADSMSGKTSTDFVNALKNGLKLVRQSNMILFMYGINDAYQGTTDATWQANIEYMIAWRNINYPDAKLVLVGATHLSNTQTTQIARLAELRAIEATYADADANIYYTSMADVVLPNYDPSSTYFTDTIHPTQASHDLYGYALGEFLKTIV